MSEPLTVTNMNMNFVWTFLGKMIKAASQERHLTQEELGQLVGVQKAQISKLESSANSATIDTILKVF